MFNIDLYTSLSYDYIINYIRKQTKMKAYKNMGLSIGNGILNIPVKVYKAADSMSIGLSNMSACCGGFVGLQNVCKCCGKVVEYQDIKKGLWDPAQNKLVPVNEDALEALKLPTAKTIEVLDFKDMADVDPRLQSGKTYVLGISEEKDKKTKQYVENEQGRKDYALLAQVLSETKTVAIAKSVFQKKEEIFAISSVNSLLVASILHYPEQIRNTDELKIAEKLNKEDLEDAVALVNSLKNKVDLKSIKDEYSIAALKILAGETVEPVKAQAKAIEGKNRWKLAAEAVKTN